MTRIQRKMRNRKVDSYAANKRRDDLIIALAARGMTLEYMKSLAIEQKCSQSMIIDLITRDYSDLTNASKMSRRALRNLLIRLGVKHDNAMYLKLPQAVKLQYKFPASWTLEDVQVEVARQGRKGALKTSETRRGWEHYTPKNHPEHYTNASSLEEAKKLALEFRRSKSPYSVKFTRYVEMSVGDMSQRIAELARNRGLKGLLSMRTGVSLLEDRVSQALSNVHVYHIRQFILGRYAYDIFIPDVNTIIEVNGTYWHADPRVYRANDDVIFPYGSIKAHTKWEKDAIKNKYAIDLGYHVVVLWEIDLHKESYLDELMSRFCRN